mgnify:CR=1 FL=1
MTTGTSTQAFKPAWWLPEGHSQTLWRKLSPPAAIELTRQRLELDDGDFIDLDWAAEINGNHPVTKDRPSPLADSATDSHPPIVVILHGLCGCSSSPYVVALQTLLTAQSIPSVTVNFRGCSGEMNRLARAYHSGVSEDVQAVFTKLMPLYPEHKFRFVGYSLGANVLLKWLGEIQSHARVDRADAISTPFSLEFCSRAMLTGLGQFYGGYFVRRLRKDFEQKKQHFKDKGEDGELQRLEALGNLHGIDSIWEFDDRTTAPLHGFTGAADYYRQCSSLGYIDSIRTSTLLLQSRNDPLIPVAAMPRKRQLNGSIKLELSAKGGHVGFISSGPDNWLEQRILKFIQA